MTRILIAYGTTEGQTARIADHLADVIRGRGFEADALDLKQSQDISFDRYDAVIVGGSIHMGKHQKGVVEFVGTDDAFQQVTRFAEDFVERLVPEGTARQKS